MRSLDYLWIGIGALLRANPQYKYMYGPVSISNTYPKIAKDMLVHFYALYFSGLVKQGKARQPYCVDIETDKYLRTLFSGTDYTEDFTILKTHLGHMGLSVPTLYKQYTELCEEDGAQFMDFNIDNEFSDCVDGLVIVEIDKIKEHKKKRYIG